MTKITVVYRGLDGIQESYTFTDYIDARNKAVELIGENPLFTGSYAISSEGKEGVLTATGTIETPVEVQDLFERIQ